MIIHNIAQNTEEWLALRRGKITASKAPSLLMNSSTKGYQDLIDDIVEERITGQAVEGKWQGNASTERGHELEPVAIEDYEMLTFETVTPVGFVELNEWVGCSPDGLIGDDKLLQIKCPIFKTQRKYLDILEKNRGLTDNDMLYKIDSNYYKQMQFELYVTGRLENVFYAYHPNLRHIKLDITRDDKLIETIKNKLVEVIAVIKNEIKKLKVA